MCNFSRIRSLLIVCFAILAPSSAWSETINVRTLALKSGEMPEIYIKGPKEYKLLEFSANQPSPVLRAVAVNPLPLYNSEMDAEGKPAFVLMQKVKLSAGAKGILLLGWNTGKETKFVAIKDDFGKARADDWLLINTTTKSIAFQIGQKTKPILIKAGVSKTHKIVAEKNKGAAVVGQTYIDGKAKVFFSTYWPVHGDKRAVVLFVDDGRKLRVKRISDKLAPPA